MTWQEAITPICKTIFERGPMIPATRWDEFKAEHFPDWLLRLCPVRYCSGRALLEEIGAAVDLVKKAEARP